ncbi:hypothetical protein, partial [Ferrimicrobium acidiphilum]|uniref:hypothetical protein n=1 Tax=Ferrimicrobium acidiphilum TaxID=121039 RepID=UPI003C6D4334
RRLLNMAKEKLTEGANDKLTRFLEAGDPDNEVATAWRAKESLRELYAYRDLGTCQRPPRCSHQ